MQCIQTHTMSCNSRDDCPNNEVIIRVGIIREIFICRLLTIYPLNSALVYRFITNYMILNFLNKNISLLYLHLHASSFLNCGWLLRNRRNYLK